MSEADGPIFILHVDDQPEFADVATTFLEREDDRFKTEIATSVDEGLERLSVSEFDCIISDYDMPSLNGIEFLEITREEHPDLPFILFTGKGDEEVASEAISKGATDYLQKGRGTEQYELLANRVRNGVEQYRSAQEATRTRRRLQTLAESTSDCVWMFDHDWGELFFISGYEEVWNRPTEGIRSDPRDFLNGVHPEDRGFVRGAMERMSNGEAIDIEYRILRGDDGIGWVWVQGAPVFDDGTVESVVGITQDITERKRHEQQLEALHGAANRLVTADDRDDIIQITIDAAKNALGFPYIIFRTFTNEDKLVPVRVSEETTERLGGQRPVYEPGEPTAGLAFSKQETVVYDDVNQFDDDYDRGDVRAAMYLPVGEYGVVTIADDESGGFSQSEINLAKIFIGHVKTAFDLVSQTRELRRKTIGWRR